MMFDGRAIQWFCDEDDHNKIMQETRALCGAAACDKDYGTLHYPIWPATPADMNGNSYHFP